MTLRNLWKLSAISDHLSRFPALILRAVRARCDEFVGQLSNEVRVYLSKNDKGSYGRRLQRVEAQERAGHDPYRLPLKARKGFLEQAAIEENIQDTTGFRP